MSNQVYPNDEQNMHEPQHIDPGIVQNNILQQQNMNQQQIDNQKVKYDNLDINNLAKIEQPRCRLPEGKQLIFGIIQFCLALIFIVLAIIEQSPSHIITYAIFSLIFGIIGYKTSPTLNYFKNIKSRQEVRQYIEQMENERPNIQYNVQAYHWETRSTKNGTQRYKKKTYDETKIFPYQQVEDKSPNIELLYTNDRIVRINSEFHYWKGSELTENNYNLFVQQLYQIARSRDKLVDGKDVSNLPNMQKEILTHSSSVPCFFSKGFALIAYLTGFMLLYDMIIYSATGELHYNMNKVIYSEVTIASQFQQINMQLPLQQSQQGPMQQQQYPQQIQPQQQVQFQPQQQYDQPYNIQPQQYQMQPQQQYPQQMQPSYPQQMLPQQQQQMQYYPQQQYPQQYQQNTQQIQPPLPNPLPPQYQQQQQQYQYQQNNQVQQ